MKTTKKAFSETVIENATELCEWISLYYFEHFRLSEQQLKSSFLKKIVENVRQSGIYEEPEFEAGTLYCVLPYSEIPNAERLQVGKTGTLRKKNAISEWTTFNSPEKWAEIADLMYAEESFVVISTTKAYKPIVSIKHIVPVLKKFSGKNKSNCFRDVIALDESESAYSEAVFLDEEDKIGYKIEYIVKVEYQSKQKIKTIYEPR